MAGGLLTAASFILVKPALALGPQCSSPYIQVQDGAPAATDPTNQYAIQSVNIGEPRQLPPPSPLLSCNGKRITAVLKVPTMDPGNTGTAAPPPNSIWTVRLTIPGSANSTGLEQNIFMSYDTSIIPAGAFDFGWQDSPGHDCNQCAGNVPPSCANTGTVAADGTITMSLDFSSTVTFGTCATTGGTNMTISPAQWTQGIQLTNIRE